MARIELRDLAHSYSGDEQAWALRPMTMTWNDGGAYALLGPSGCGKTTLLNIISGLLAPTRGRILFDGEDVTRAEPQDRNIAQVFQFPVIYDTMTVFDNLAFPLRNRGWHRTAIRSRVHEVAELLELSGDLPRRARGLTADAKQKISLGRGLVRPDVAAVLFDEPLTVIDPHLKWLLRRKLKQIHQQLKLSLIYVTHDQVEALTFADQVVVMTQGEVVQIGTPQELFETPAHTFVGYFIGNPGMNLLPCTLADDAVVVDGHALPFDRAMLRRARAQGDTHVVGIRPEFIELATAPATHTVAAQVIDRQFLGTHTMVRAALGKQDLWIKAPSDAHIALGQTVLRMPPDRALLYADGKRVI